MFNIMDKNIVFDNTHEKKIFYFICVTKELSKVYIGCSFSENIFIPQQSICGESKKDIMFVADIRNRKLLTTA